MGKNRKRPRRHEIATALPLDDDLLGAWSSLYDRAAGPTPFLHPAWVLNWWHAFGRPSWDIHLSTAWIGSELIGLMPLYVSRERWSGHQTRVARLWADPHSNRAGPLLDAARAEDAAEIIAEGLRSRAEWDVAFLEFVHLASPGTQAFLSGLERQELRFGTTTGYRSPFMALPRTMEAAEAGLSSSFRSSLRNKENKLRRVGFTVEEFHGAAGAAHAFDISRDTWQHERGTGLQSQPRIARFFEGMLEDPWLRDRLRVLILSVDDEPIAFEWNLEEGGILFNLKVGYRASAAELSPGIVLRRHAVARAIPAGLTEFDFLGEAERYKLDWATGTRQHGSVVIFRPGPRGALSHTLHFKLRPGVKRLPGVARLVKLLRRINSGASTS